MRFLCVVLRLVNSLDGDSTAEFRHTLDGEARQIYRYTADRLNAVLRYFVGVFLFVHYGVFRRVELFLQTSSTAPFRNGD